MSQSFVQAHTRHVLAMLFSCPTAVTSALCRTVQANMLCGCSAHHDIQQATDANVVLFSVVEEHLDCAVVQDLARPLLKLTCCVCACLRLTGMAAMCTEGSCMRPCPLWPFAWPLLAKLLFSLRAPASARVLRMLPGALTARSHVACCHGMFERALCIIALLTCIACLVLAGMASIAGAKV